MLHSSSGNITERRLSSPNSFKRRSLEKKVTPVKTIRKPTSITRSANGRMQQIRESFFSRERPSVNLIPSDSSAPKRWLRSDTIAAIPIKTLRSRNVEIAGQVVPTQSEQFPQHSDRNPKIIETPNRFKQHQQPFRNSMEGNSIMDKPIAAQSTPGWLPFFIVFFIFIFKANGSGLVSYNF